MSQITNIKAFLIISIILAFIHANPVGAQTSQNLYVTISDTKGNVEIMKMDTHQWVPAKIGNIFKEGTQVRTGPFSSASLVFADSSFILIDSFTYLTINTFSITEDVVKTNIYLSVGSVVGTLNENLPFENDYKIETPTLTTSLSGSEIKKVVAGAMYGDTIRMGYRKGSQKKKESAQQIASEKQR